MMTRRQAIKTTALAGAALATLPGAIAQIETGPGDLIQTLVSTAPTPAALPPLPYAYDALEPHIDARTMKIHHDRHHKTYVDNLNKALMQFDWSGFKATDEGWLTSMLKNLDSVPESIRTAVRNNGGGHYNHSLFWQLMKKDGGGGPAGGRGEEGGAGRGSFAALREGFTQGPLRQFGAGWVWWVVAG